MSASSVYMLTAANIIYLICYGVRDVLWLRILAIVAMFTIIPYYIWGTETLQWTCIWWQLAFIAINGVWVGVIINERRHPQMSADQERLYNLVFRDRCSPNEMLNLLATANWQEADIGIRLVNKGTQFNQLLLIYEGEVSVHIGGQLFARSGPGDLIGEMSYLSSQLTIADVYVTRPLRYVCWQSSDLNRLFERRPELKSTVNELIGLDLVTKLRTSHARTPELAMGAVVYPSDAPEFSR